MQIAECELMPGQVDTAGIDILLVGDSVAMVVHGHDTTLPVTMEDMLVHCKAVSRGARRSFPSFPVPLHALMPHICADILQPI